MITREELNDKALKEVQDLLMADVADFSAQVETKSVEELDEMAKEIGEKIDEEGKRVAEVEYELPATTPWEDKNHHAEAIAKSIAKFIEGIEVEWRATLGVYQAIKFWSKDFKGKVPYNVLDSTLRMLGMLKFKGMTACKNILIINNWLSSVHTQYAVDNIYQSYLHEMFDTIVRRRDELIKPTPEAEDGEAKQTEQTEELQ